MLFKIGVLKSFAIFTEKKPVLEPFFDKVAALKAAAAALRSVTLSKDIPTQVFACEYC